MKKVFILVALCATVFVTSQAQSFVSGSFSYTSESGTIKDGANPEEDKESMTSFEIMPRYGYNLNEKWAIGLGIAYISTTQEEPMGADVLETNTSLIGFAPFARFTFAKAGKFNFIAEAQFAYLSGSQEESMAGETVNGPDLSIMDFSIAPVLQFNITEKWALEATFNAFSLGYSSQTAKQAEDLDHGIDASEETDNSFNLGAGTDDLMNTGSISISAIYKF